MTNTQKFELVYTGAPYGLNEYGEVISTHRTYDAAQKAASKIAYQAKYYNNLAIKQNGLKIID